MSRIVYEHAPDNKKWLISLVKLDPEGQANRCLFCIEGVEQQVPFLKAYLITHIIDTNPKNFVQLRIQSRDHDNEPVIQVMPSISYFAEAQKIKSVLYRSIEKDIDVCNERVQGEYKFSETPRVYTNPIANVIKDRFLSMWCEDKLTLLGDVKQIELRLTPTSSQQSTSTLTPVASRKNVEPEEPESRSCCKFM